MATTRAILTPYSAEFPATNFPQLTQQATTLRAILAFDAATNESCWWTLGAWQGLSGALTAVVTYTMASATSNTVKWDVAIEAIADNEATGSDTYDTANTSGGVTVPGTAGLMDQISVTLTNADGIVAGDMVRLKLTRDAATDTATGDAHVFYVELREA